MKTKRGYEEDAEAEAEGDGNAGGDGDGALAEDEGPRDAAADGVSRGDELVTRGQGTRRVRNVHGVDVALVALGGRVASSEVERSVKGLRRIRMDLLSYEI